VHKAIGFAGVITMATIPRHRGANGEPGFRRWRASSDISRYVNSGNPAANYPVAGMTVRSAIYVHWTNRHRECDSDERSTRRCRMRPSCAAAPNANPLSSPAVKVFSRLKGEER